MKIISKKHYVMFSVIVCAAVMSIVDGVVQPPYAVKSAVKVVLFLLVPLFYFYCHGEVNDDFKALFSPCKWDVLTALALGVGVFVFILTGYWIITCFFDLTDIILRLTGDGGVSGENFIWVSSYIALVNSLLEEFLFRGFGFLSLKRLTGRKFAYLFSAALFAFYHFGMIAGGGNVLIWVAAMAGLFIAGIVLNFLNERSGNIITSWLVHMFANLAINTIGFRVFGLI